MNIKLLSIKSLALGAGVLALSGIASAQTAVTKPVGYQTFNIKQGFNVAGVNFVGAPLVAGTVTGVAGTGITDDNADFSGLDTNAAHTIEFANGAWSQIESIAGTTVTTQTDISGSVANGDSYVIRAVKTLSDLFGANNSAGLGAGGTSDDADIIWVPSGGGEFSQYYYSDGTGPAFLGITEGWRLVGGGNDDQAGAGVLFTDGIILQSKGADAYDVTFTGHVKTTPTSIAITQGFTYLSRIYPSGATFGNSNLQSVVEPGGTSDESDIIWQQQADDLVAYDQYYYSDGTAPAFLNITEGWHAVADGADSADTALTSAFILQKKGDDYNLTLTPPAFYSDL